MTSRLLGLFSLLMLLASATVSLAKAPARLYCDYAVKQCDLVEKGLPEITRVANIVAQRHLNGGAIGFVIVNGTTLCEELTGRAGGMVNLGFDRVWTKERTEAQKANDVALVSWQKAPGPNEVAKLQELKKQGMYIVGFGPKTMPELAEQVKFCDAFFDTGTGSDDRVVKLADGSKGGRSLNLINTLNGWAFVAEVVSALTRQGKMPTMYLAYLYPEGVEWGNRYLWKKQFHDDYTVAPIAAGTLGKAYLRTIRGYIETFRRTQLPAVAKAVSLIYPEVKDGKKLLVLPTGHMPYTYVGVFEDSRWVNQVDFEYMGHKDAVINAKAQGQLVLRLGYFGEAPDMKEVLRSQQFRMIYISSDNPREGYKIPEERLLNIDTGMPFGDACVSIANYPIKLFAPSGVMQIVAYEAVNTEILARLAAKK